jgi:chemotaxis protein methyltransferase CheR
MTRSIDRDSPHAAPDGTMTDQDYDFLRDLIRERSAIVLDDGKRYLVETRLAPVVRREKLGTIGGLVARLRASRSGALSDQVIESMVTTESSFFRDVHPFESLRKRVIPELIRRRSAERSLNVWCAACATGQEPYSLAILLREDLPELDGWKINLLATDLSRDILARAREGRFGQLEVNRGLPAALLHRYFQKHGATWQVNADIRAMVEFRELNLARPWPYLPRMDLVLLRNVMIYFEVDMKKSILGRLAEVLRPDGYLLLGGSETTLFLDDSYRRIEDLSPGFYQLIE